MSRPSLLDSETLGEDHDANIRRALDYAPAHCGACLNYHMLFPIRRGIGRVALVWPDRDALMATIGHLVAGSAASGPIDVVIAGCADTQLLAACAHGARVHAGAQYDRVHFTVLDRCDTPLELCRNFAARHGLATTTQALDLTAHDAPVAADIVVVHSLFRFLPPDTHLPALRRMASWLKPDGHLVFSTALRPPDARSANKPRYDEADALIRAALESGRLAINEPRAAFEARLSDRGYRLSDFSEPAEVYDLFAGAGLSVRDMSQHRTVPPMPSGHGFKRHRILAVLSRSVAERHP